MTPTDNCIFTVRMAKDFGRDALPTRSGEYYPPRRGPIQTLTTWNHILRVADLLHRRCILERPANEAGWAMVSEGIVVAFWPRYSVINERFGPTIPLAIESPNVTDALSS